MPDLKEAEIEKRISGFDRTVLTSIVSRMFGVKQVELINWHYQLIEGGYGGAYGPYRIQGLQTNTCLAHFVITMHFVVALLRDMDQMDRNKRSQLIGQKWG